MKIAQTDGINAIGLALSRPWPEGTAITVRMGIHGAEDLDRIDRPLASSLPTAGNLPRLRTEFVGSLANLQLRVDALPQTLLATLTTGAASMLGVQGSQASAALIAACHQGHCCIGRSGPVR